MTRRTSLVALIFLLGRADALAAPARAAPPRDVKARTAKQAEIQRALAAAPPALRAGAAVARMDESGRLTQLRDGDNGWTCLPRDPGTPAGDPLCFDQNGLAWMQAAMAGRPPDPTKIGWCYMLAGGTIWSNTDPTATALPAGETTHITIPPHVMILNARIAAESGFPGGPHPDTRRPFVMYAGTPYANVTIPVR